MKQLNLDLIKEGLLLKAVSFAKSSAPIYKTMNWKWTGIGVPNEENIMHALNNLISQLDATSFETDIPGCEVSAGGLLVGYKLYRDSYGVVVYIKTYIKFEFQDGSWNDIKLFLKDKT